MLYGKYFASIHPSIHACVNDAPQSPTETRAGSRKKKVGGRGEIGIEEEKEKNQNGQIKFNKNPGAQPAPLYFFLSNLVVHLLVIMSSFAPADGNLKKAPPHPPSAPFLLSLNYHHLRHPPHLPNALLPFGTSAYPPDCSMSSRPVARNRLPESPSPWPACSHQRSSIDSETPSAPCSADPGS